MKASVIGGLSFAVLYGLYYSVPTGPSMTFSATPSFRINRTLCITALALASLALVVNVWIGDRRIFVESDKGSFHVHLRERYQLRPMVIKPPGVLFSPAVFKKVLALPVGRPSEATCCVGNPPNDVCWEPRSRPYRILFHSNQLSVRGTEVALFDYADMFEKLACGVRSE